MASGIRTGHGVWRKGYGSPHDSAVESIGYNQRAICLYGRLGFQAGFAGMLNGKRHDQLIMDVLRTEFQPKHSSCL